jgi:hypothetical protein
VPAPTAAAPTAAAAPRPVTPRRARAARPAAPLRPAVAHSDWTCAITWHSGMRGANFRALASGPGVREREIARSVKVDWPPIVPPPAEPDIVRAARGLARSLVAAGWQPADRGPDWYSQRFVWTRTDEPSALG